MLKNTSVERDVIAKSHALKPSLNDVCKAVCDVVPLLILDRFGTLSRCYEACAAGAAVIQSYGFDAVVIPAVALIVSRDPDVLQGCGYASSETIRHWLQNSRGIVWDSTHAKAYDPTGGHVVIRVDNKGLLDLTLGQVNANYPGLVPKVAINALNAGISLDAGVIDWGPNVDVSWHKPKSSAHIHRTIHKVVKHAEKGCLLDDVKAAVAFLLTPGVDMGLWLDSMPKEFLYVITAKLAAVGFAQ